MKGTFTSTWIIWWFIAASLLYNGNICHGNTTDVTTTESYTTVYQKPDASKRNLSLSVLINDSVSLNCSFDISSGKNIIWWFEEKILFIDSKTSLESVTNVRYESNGTSSSLHIEGFHSNNTGLYVCKRGKNDTGLSAYLGIIRPITKLSLFFVNKSLTNPTSVTVQKNKTYIFRCYGDGASFHPFMWTKDDKIAVANTNPYNNFSSTLDDTKYFFGSELILEVKYTISNITCQTGNHKVTVVIEVESDIPPLLALQPFFIGIAGFVFIVLFVASACYCVCTRTGRKSKNPTSCHSSIYSMPSITSNDPHDNSDNRKSHGDRDGIRDSGSTKESAKKHVTNTLSPFDLDYVDPILQHPTTSNCNTLERDLNQYGIQLQCMRSKDDLNEFWEATLPGGNFNERIIVRSLSGKATVDLLEEFRKFMISLQELPPHDNVWSVLGIAKEKLPYRICYEYHDQTSLRDYLLGNFQSHGSDGGSPHNQTQTLVALAFDIVDAMVFLKSYAFDHVAVRTEKILLDVTENCKLYDFCLSSQSQEIARRAVHQNQILPWLAPELIFLEEYNQWTDIWAFGVVLWELWCGGRTPHCGKSRENLEKDLRNQQFLVQPPNCPGAVYSLMLSCWKNNASERKMFTDLRKAIDDLKIATENSWYGAEDYSTVGSSSFYTVLDNTYDAQ